MGTILIINILNLRSRPKTSIGPQFVSAGTGIASIMLTTNSKERSFWTHITNGEEAQENTSMKRPFL